MKNAPDNVVLYLVAARMALADGALDAAVEHLCEYQRERRAGAAEPTGVTGGDELAHAMMVQARRKMFRVIPGGRS